MKTISKTALVALTLAAAAIGGQAQAHTEWRYSFKGLLPPYAVPHEHKKSVSPAWKGIRLYARRKHRRTALLSDAPIIVAHHKPEYHDGLPRTSGPTAPEPPATGKPRADAGLSEAGDLMPVALA